MMPKQVQAQVESIVPLTDSILQLIVRPDHYVDYQAGQYLQILSNQEAFSYSIANAPLGSHKYELHLRHSKENAFTQQLLADIKAHGRISLNVPLGECHINQLHKSLPIVFVAAGTGFAPIKAMIESLLAASDERAAELYWSARSRSDLYMDEKVNQWQAHVGHFRYFSFLSSNPHKTSLAKMLLAQHEQDLLNWQYVLSGPFEMVYQMRDVLIEKGVPVEHLFSDAFGFER